MPPRTNTERIDEVAKQLQEITLQSRTQTEVSRIRTEKLEDVAKEQQATLTKLQDKLNELAAGIAMLEQRCAALEKHTDRTWQIWLALVGAGLAILISLVKK